MLKYNWSQVIYQIFYEINRKFNNICIILTDKLRGLDFEEVQEKQCCYYGFFISFSVFFGVRKIALEEDWPPFGVRVRVRVRVKIRVEGQFSSPVIVLEPFSLHLSATRVNVDIYFLFKYYLLKCVYFTIIFALL